MEFGDVIKAHREMRGLTQDQVADAVKTTPATVGRWERNRHRPHPRHLQSLAKLYETDAMELVAPARPAYARKLLSASRRELLAEDPSLLGVERDPFSWRLRQVMRWRGLDQWTGL